jgi:hypothetical protein
LAGSFAFSPAMALLSVRRIVSRRERMTSMRCIGLICCCAPCRPETGLAESGSPAPSTNAHRTTNAELRKRII